MLCPYCKESHKHRVLDTDTKIGPCILRQRECLGCGERFSSVEYPTDAEGWRRLYDAFVRPAQERARKLERANG